MRIRYGAVWLGLVAPVLIAAHAIPLYYLFSHKVLSAAVIAGVLAVVLIKHLGFLGPLARLFLRQKTRRSNEARR